MKKAKMILMSILLVFTFSMLAGCGTKNGRKAADETKKRGGTVTSDSRP